MEEDLLRFCSVRRNCPENDELQASYIGLQPNLRKFNFY